MTYFDTVARIIHLYKKITVLGFHRYLIDAGVDKWTFKYRLKFWPLDVSK